MKKLLFMLFMLTSSIYSQNSDLNINLKNGSKVTLSTADIQRIVFGNLTPVELANFSLSLSNGSVCLEWVTVSEINNYGFEIERRKAIDQRNNWVTVGSVKGHGTINQVQSYTFEDTPEGSGVYFYRLKQIDTDGGYEYSDELEITFAREMKYVLKQNYPNPFNPSTTIEYQIPRTAKVMVSIFDVSGQLVKEMLDETQTEGVHQVIWDGTDQKTKRVASGIYIYTVRSGELIISNKMILVK